ncbi:hypothetical protein NOR_01538 [Metarhizium rileyi]|uniref:RecQ mediated genome instability protein 1 OB-fold domain-containing protein n=1 Tax=Metarhizium rileyi (strain RCEF 4871) TaxID=1649241 RepID=A0A167IZ81_METRR|nr:hypothetical protein NOR_01538 [Metarhizium rileyi RCEF 4871]TWU78177.1 hypothetical protein ED733_007696 [Metarhizium rileyi]
MDDDTTARLLTSITSQSLPPPSHSLMTSLGARTPRPPLSSLVATAKARLLAADLTSSTYLDRSQLSAFPTGSDSVTVKELRLRSDTHVQVVDVENLNLSRWDQIEKMEAVERGESTRGREVIRVADEEVAGAERETPTGGTGTRGVIAASRKATHRLVLQDCEGTMLYAVELKRIDGVGVGKTSIGCKAVLRSGTVVSRGTVLLTTENCVFLGGKIDAWHDAWMSGRKARLKEAAGVGDGHGHGETTTTR